MKKLVLCLAVLSGTALVHLSASAIGNESSRTIKQEIKSSEFVETGLDSHKLYQEIDFSTGEILSEDVFTQALNGYHNLEQAGMLDTGKRILSVADFTLPSTKNRLWVIDLKAKKVLFNTYVAHGQGSGMDLPTRFSNQDGTHASSLGFYVTAGTYNGAHGNSLRLNGMDKGFNDAALSRGIVVHAAEYVSSGNIAGQGRLGRSWGCPAVNPALAQPIINTIKGGTCLFIYHSTPEYLSASRWLKTPANQLKTEESHSRLASAEVGDSMKTRL